jgi:hypothetical protein
MTNFSYSEDILVERPANALIDVLGWETASVYDLFSDGGRREYVTGMVM